MNEDLNKIFGPMKDHFSKILIEYINGQEKNVSKRLENISYAFDRMSEALEEKEESDLAGLVSSASTGVSQLAVKLDHTDPKEILSLIEEQSKNNTSGVFFASVLAGFVSARVVRHSIPEGATTEKSNDLHNTETFSETDYERSGKDARPDHPTHGQMAADHLRKENNDNFIH